jgi:molybdopterin biosynthesis enzyme
VKAIALRRGGARADLIEGRIAGHDVRGADGKIALRKGEVIDARGVATVLAAPWDELHLLELEPGDLHEEPAGERVSRAAAGDGVELRGYQGGQWTLAAARRGLLRVHEAALAGVNALAGISVFTLYDLRPVEPGETVAKAKVTPLAIGGAVIEEAESLAARAKGLVSVQAFAPRVVGVVARENLEPAQRTRFEGSLREKLDWFGSRLLPVRYTGGDADAVAREIEATRGEGADMIIVAGASALDPLDPVFLGIERAGGRMERVGAPAHPGSLLFLAWAGAQPMVGMPTCGMFSQATTFDLVLPRLLAGERLGNAELAALGHGGLMSRESAFRFPPYRKTAERGELGQ